MRFGSVLTRTALMAIAAGGLVSCGTEEGTRGSIEFLRYSDGRTVAAEAGGPISDFEPIGVKLVTPAGVSNSNVKVRLVSTGTGSTFYAGLLSDLTGATPLGSNVELTTNDFGVVEVTLAFQYSAPISGEFVMMTAFSGTASNQYTLEFECFEATAVAPDCP